MWRVTGDRLINCGLFDSDIKVNWNEQKRC